jgi:hypothetical protein
MRQRTAGFQAGLVCLQHVPRQILLLFSVLLPTAVLILVSSEHNSLLNKLILILVSYWILPVSFIQTSMALQPVVGSWPLLQFRNLFYTVSRTTWTSDQPVARPLPIHRTTQTCIKHTHRHPCLEWDSNSRSLRPSKQDIHTLDCAATVIGLPVAQW